MSGKNRNKTRNDRIFASRDISSRYLPDELRVYSADFNNSGRWVQVPDYGNCWIPTVGVYGDWASSDMAGGYGEAASTSGLGTNRGDGLIIVPWQMGIRQ